MEARDLRRIYENKLQGNVRTDCLKAQSFVNSRFQTCASNVRRRKIQKPSLNKHSDIIFVSRHVLTEQHAIFCIVSKTLVGSTSGQT